MTIFDLAAKLTLDSSEYESGIASASSSASSFASKIGSGLKTAAKVGATAIAAVTTAVTATATAFTKAVSSVAAYGDEIDKNSQKLGISAEAYQEWNAVLEHSGTSMDSMTAAFKTLANAAVDATDDQVAAFERLGLSMEEISSMSTEELWSSVISGLQEMEEGAERTATATDLLGRSATELGALFNTSAEDTQAMIDRVNELGGVLSDDAVKAAAAYTDSVQDMKTAFSGLSRNMTSEFLPALTEVIDGLTQIFSGDYTSGLDQISSGIDQIVDKVGELAPDALEVAGGIVTALVTALSENSGDILQAALTMITTLGQGLLDNLPTLVDSATQMVSQMFQQLATKSNGKDIATYVVELVSQLANFIAEAAPDLIPAAVDLILGLVEGLTDPENVGLLVDAAVALVVGLSEGLANAMPLLIEALPTIIENVITAVIENLPALLEGLATAWWTLLAGQLDALGGEGTADRILEWFKGVPDAISNFFSETLPGVIDDIKNWFEGIPQWFEELPGKIGTAISTAVSEVAKFGTEVYDWASSTIPGVVDNIQTFFSELPGKIWNWLSETVSKFGQFVSDLWSSASEKIPKLVSDIVSWFEELPSKIVEVGSNIVEGLWNGISSGWDWLKTKVKELASNLISSVKSVLGIKSPSRVFRSIGEFVTEGFTEGIDDGITDVIKAAERMSNAAIDAVETDPWSDWTANMAYQSAGYSSAQPQKKTSDTLMEQIAETLAQIRDKSGNVYLDGDQIVGFVDTTMGEMSTQKARAYG